MPWLKFGRSGSGLSKQEREENKNNEKYLREKKHFKRVQVEGEESTLVSRLRNAQSAETESKYEQQNRDAGAKYPDHK